MKFNSLKLKNSYALITGATSGIGLEISRELAKLNYSLILVARRKNKLKEICQELKNKFNIKTDFYATDLEDPKSPEKLYNFCKEKNYFIDLLVNNAGYALPDSFHKTPLEAEEKFLRVLGIAVVALTKLFINDMINKRKGKIMMISSVAAYTPPSTIQVLYGPIKTFINRFSEGLNLSYNHIGITSTAVCPGYTVTNFHTASGVQDEMDRVPSFMKKSATRIAKEAVKATLIGKKTCVPTFTYKLIVFLIKILPKSLFWIFSKNWHLEGMTEIIFHQ